LEVIITTGEKQTERGSDMPETSVCNQELKFKVLKL